jgi:malate/lactate dehydrogenase
MRHLTKLLLTAGLAVAFVSLTLAQQPMRGGGGFQLNEAALLVNKSVQEELKLTDAQKEKQAKIDEKFKADMKEAVANKDREAFTKINETRNTAATEVIKDLKPEQHKRLVQIFVQVNTTPPMMGKGGRGGIGNPLVVFENEEVQKELKLTDKQKEMVKTIASDTQKDVKEIRDNIPKGDKDARTAANEKIQGLNKAAVEKITTSFTDDQKKLWKDLPGEKFEIKFDGGGRPGKKKDTE